MSRLSPLSRLQTPAGRLTLTVLAALAIRLVVVSFVFRGLPDPVRDHELFGQEVGWIARSIASHQGFSSPFFPTTGPTALLPPLYPFLLSIVFRIFGIYTAGSALAILSINSLLSALTCIPIYKAARISHGERIARYSGWAWAIYPFAIYFSAGRVWEYSLTSLLFASCFWLVLRLQIETRRFAWFGFGLMYGLAALSNPSVFSVFPFLVLLSLFKIRQKGGPWLRSGLLALLGVFAVVSPWTVRNYRTLHIVCPVRDNFWEELWSGNTGDTSSPMPGWTHPGSNPAEMKLYQAYGEVPYLAQKREMAVARITQHPLSFATLTLRRAAYYWTGCWSLAPDYVRSEPFQLPNVFFCSSLTLLMLFGMRSWWRMDSDAALPYLILIVVFPLTYYISHPLMDYRQPIEPVIVPLIVVGVQSLRERWRAKDFEFATEGEASLSLHDSETVVMQ